MAYTYNGEKRIEVNKRGIELQPCGTPAAYRRHIENKEPVCGPCQRAWNHYLNDNKRKRGIKKREPAKCGTPAGYNKHYRKKETICDECIHAFTSPEYREKRRARRKLQPVDSDSVSS